MLARSVKFIRLISLDLSLSLEKMSDTETDLSSNSEEENDGGYSREELFVKDLFGLFPVRSKFFWDKALP